MGKTKRILSFFIALIMVLALVPFNAIVYAVDVETGDEAQTPSKSEPLASDINTEDAFLAALEKGSVVLGGNITLSKPAKVAEGKTATIDLNGYALTVANASTTYAIANMGTLTIKDSVGTGSVTARGIYNGYDADSTYNYNAKLTIESGTFNAVGENGGAAVFNYGVAELNGGKYTSVGSYSLNTQAGKMTIGKNVVATGGLYNASEVIVNGASISGTRSGCHTIYNWNAKLTVNGGDFYNYNSGNSTIMAAGTSNVEINGGTFGIKDGRVPGNGNTWTSCLTDTQNTASLVVNGGTFNGGFRVQGGTTMTINGGTFNDVGGSGYNVYNGGVAVVNGGTFEDAAAQSFAKKYVAEGLSLNDKGEVVDADGNVVAKPELPTATVAPIQNNSNVLFGLTFSADSVTAEQLEAYGDYFADFVITFNKDLTLGYGEGTDGWLSGNYGDYGWVNVPTIEKKISVKANTSYRVMDIAAELLGKDSLHITYDFVVKTVQEFQCGVYLTPEFVAENPDFGVEIGLSMFEPVEDANDNTVLGEEIKVECTDANGAPMQTIFKNEDISLELPSATVTLIENPDLSFGLTFEVNDITDAQLDYYGDWFADFTIEFNVANSNLTEIVLGTGEGADGWLSGNYGDYGWINVPYNGNVTIELGKPIKVMDFAAKHMGKDGLKITYREVYELVKEFNCGVYLTPEFIEANGEFTVSVDLAMFEEVVDENGNVTEVKHDVVYTDKGGNVIDKADVTVFDKDDVYVAAVAQIGDTKYATLGEAMAALKDGDTLTLLADIDGASVQFIEFNGKKNITITAAQGVVINGSIQVGYHASHIDNGVDRSESTFTVDGLTVTGTLTVNSNDKNVVVKNCDAAQITVKTYTMNGMNITIDGNTVDGTMGTADNKYGMFLVPNATDYNLVVNNNTFKEVNSHAFVIQGTGDGSAVTAANSIAVTSNIFESWGLGGSSNRAAFKIWGDTKYAPASSDLNGTTNAMRELVDKIAASGNTYLSTADNTVEYDAFGAAGDAEDFPAAATYVAQIGNNKYETLEEAFAAAQAGETIVLLADATPALTSQRRITAASVIDLNGFTLTLTEDDLYFGTTTFKNGNIVVDPSVNTSTAAFWMFDDQTLTFDNVKITATGVSGCYLIGLQGKNAYLNITNGTEIIVENENIVNLTAVVSHNGTGKVTISDSKISVSNINGRAFLGGSYVVENSDIDATGVKAGFYIRANQSLEIKGTSTVDISNLANGYTDGIYLANAEVVYTKADTASVNSTVTQFKTYVAQIGENKYETLEDALNAAQAGDEVILLADVAEDVTVPAGVIFNGNGKQVGVITAAGEITFKGHTKTTNFGVQYTNTTINIIEGACLELTGSDRMVIGHGCTFNITGTITDAKTADKANITPSLIAAGASFTGAGVNFNVTNAYVKFTAYCSSKNSSANGTFNFDVENSIWEQTGSFVFSEPTSGKDPTFNLTLKNSVLDSTSHLVFAVAKGEIVFDNSNVNVGASRQIENRSTLTIKNGSVVNGAVATSSNAKNPGTIIVENATYAVTGEFTGSDVGTGTLVIKKGANITIGKITKANIVIDATDMVAGEIANFTANLSAFAGELSVINNDKLEAKIVDGKIVLSAKPVAKIGDTKYETLEDAIAAAKNGDEVVILVAGTYTVPSGKDITITGAVDSVVFDNIKKHAMGGASVTFNNVTFNYSMTEGHNGLQHSGDLVYNNCTFNGQVFLYGTSETFNNCTFNQTDVNNYNVWTYAADDVEFNGCTFYSEGRSLLIYSEGTDLYANVVITDCDFISSNAVDGKAAIEMDSSLSAGIKVTIDAATTATGFGNGNVSGNSLWNNKKGNETAANNDITVVVNGVTVLAPVTYVAQIGDKKYTSLEDAIAAAQNGETVVLLANIEDSATIKVVGKSITINLAGYTISGTCNAGQASLIYIENNAALTVKDTVGEGKITYAQGASNVGWTIDVEGKFVLESGTIELTGSWSIGYAVDVRPNAWGSEYTNPSVFTMNGGSIVSSDGAVRVASSSYDEYKKVSASFVMNNGTIDAAWDGVFIQQSNAAYDVLSFTMNGGTINSGLNPVRVYGPAPTSYVNGQNCMKITLAGGTMTYTGAEAQTWVIEGILRVGGGSSVKTIVENGAFTVSAAIAESATAPEGYVWSDNGDGTCTLAVKPEEKLEIWGTSLVLEGEIKMNFYFSENNKYVGTDYYAIIRIEGSDEETIVPMSEWGYNTSTKRYFVTVGMPAKCMTENIFVEIAKDGVVLTEEFYNSIEYYAYSVIYGSYSEDLKSLMVNMLVYGAEAQKLFNYNTDFLATNYIDAATIQKYATNMETPDDPGYFKIDEAEGTYYFYDNTLELEADLGFNFYYVFKRADRNKLKVTTTYVDFYGETHTNVLTGEDLIFNTAMGSEMLKVAVRGLKSTDVFQAVTVVVEYDGAVVSTVTESMAGYCHYRMGADDLLDGVCLALLKYGAAAEKYFG